MDKTHIKYLLAQYTGNTASAEEVKELFQLMQQAKTSEILKAFIAEATKEEETEIDLQQQQWNRIWLAIQSAVTPKPQKQKISSMLWVRAAAAIILFVVAGSIIFFADNKKQVAAPATANKPYKNDVLPGGNKAILTLADGTKIVLDSVQNGSLAKQGNTDIVKIGSGQLVYNAGSNKTNAILYNTVSTPSGGKYQLTLPDGSKIWLNAASTLRFPASFVGKERNVALTGEAYFEVAHLTAEDGQKKPFTVHVSSASGDGGMDVKVLGTHFNIMAYPNEQTIKTTLLEGKVKVTQDGAVKNLEPGMQAIVDKQTHTLKITDANIDQSMGWKNDMFRFKETGIKEIMRQVERWYNVEVEYRTQGSEQDYTGVIPRTQNVSALLQTLELTGTVHFQVEQSNIPGKSGKIIVLP